MNDCENNFIREAIEVKQEVDIHFKNKRETVRGVIVNKDEKTIEIRTKIGFDIVTHQLIYRDSIERIVETF